MSRIRLSLAAATFALAACSTGGVTVQRADGVVIPEHARYAWAALPGAAVAGEGDPLVANDIVHDRVHAEIDSVLALHGWERTAPDSARFTVRYAIGRRLERGSYVTTTPGYTAVPVLRCGVRNCWSGWSWGGYGMPLSTTHAYSYPEGTLLVDVVERATGKLVWRGIGTEPLDAKDLEPARLGREVARVLQSLPGGTGGTGA